MIPVRGYAGKRVAVLGMGRSGLSAGRALIAGGADVICWDDGQSARDRAGAEGLTVANPAQAIDQLDLLVTSPGIPHLYPAPNPHIAAALAAGVAVDNDISLFFQSYATPEWDNFEVTPKVIAVTGSNGKSTTSALIHHILVEAGRPTQLAGNIGRGVLDLDPAHGGEVVVLELSSYQTELARAMTPDIGVFTNLTPDHLDRHGGAGGYFAAKARLFTEGGPDRAVIGVDEVEGQYLANRLGQNARDDRVIRISVAQKLTGDGWHVSVKKGFLAESRKGRQVASIDLRGIDGLPGSHNHQNACAAYGALRSLGLAPRQIEAGFHTFLGLPHRSQKLLELNGVTYVNDSKATNVDSAAKALEAFKNIHWICGGLQKEGGLDSLQAGQKNVKAAYVIGREAENFARNLIVPAEICTDMARAVAAAHAAAVPGDIVLLAPAAASFDQYDSFEARGDHFAELVTGLG